MISTASKKFTSVTATRGGTAYPKKPSELQVQPNARKVPAPEVPVFSSTDIRQGFFQTPVEDCNRSKPPSSRRTEVSNALPSLQWDDHLHHDDKTDLRFRKDGKPARPSVSIMRDPTVEGLPDAVSIVKRLAGRSEEMPFVDREFFVLPSRRLIKELGQLPAQRKLRWRMTNDGLITPRTVDPKGSANWDVVILQTRGEIAPTPRRSLAKQQMEAIKPSVPAADPAAIPPVGGPTTRKLPIRRKEGGKPPASAAGCYMCRGPYYTNCCPRKGETNDRPANQVKLEGAREEDDDLLDLDHSLDSDSESEK
ncbi:hypothetical protein BDBG_17425 [Blastomyces gilchristii SLH14081]|uniref:Uncharacterized protein n=1 Tax=Blastomyces gilchristii (strain SLH14081) TaxID=559298 RepID=A0A179USR3_BLAGS|nr:uncharacterized protein BDBG_17425 [Blastomyces gilchristii SLH14081]OAT10900.1 hypothetical protein BDBG_17425 [Blastomyces gilchristii SLH14081]